jgi:hypothetical protein
MYSKSLTGYRIVTDAAQRRLVVPDVEVSGFHYEHGISLPQGLFRRFARLPRSETAILDFAIHYGELGLEGFTSEFPSSVEDFDSGEPETPGFTTFGGLPGEYLEAWYERIQEMRSVVNVGDALLAVNDRKLARLVQYKYGAYWCLADPMLSQVEADESLRNAWARIKRGQDMRLAAKEYVFRNLFINLSGGTISFDVQHDNTYRIRLIETGNGLLKGMWLQFARWYCQESEHITHEGMLCHRPGCGTRFTAKSLKARWCSPACRQAAYRLSLRNPAT